MARTWLLMAVAFAATSTPAFAQSPPAGRSQPIRVRPAGPLQTPRDVRAREPSTLELRAEIADLSRQVEALSERVAELNGTLAGRITAIDDSIHRLRRLERDRYWQMMRTIFTACVNATRVPTATALTMPQAINDCSSGHDYAVPGQDWVVE